MTALHFRRAARSEGITDLIPPGGPLSRLSLALLVVDHERPFTLPGSDLERVAVLLNGSGRVSIDGRTEELKGRRSVFDGPAGSIYLPPGATAEIEADHPALEFAVVGAPGGDASGPAVVITADDVGSRSVGEGNWSREVRDIAGADFPAASLLVGETINPPGNWSSAPPHRHDRDSEVETQLEELYLYRFNPESGFAMQRIYSEEGDLDLAYAVQHDDAVAVPRGFHPVVAAPGYGLWYLWALAGPRRELVAYLDPKHRWVQDQAAGR